MVKDDVIKVENRTSALSATVSSSTSFFLGIGDLKGEVEGDSLPLFSLGVSWSAFSCSLDFPFGVTTACSLISSSDKPLAFGGMPRVSFAPVGTSSHP